ncbi:helix-turn-helix domain-containing protein [Streptomyces sp. NPDC058256]|uniref:helix-turn-helix domain-containing protein n=1 Tax=Streptomyces sp. NPDC058256 TaxID=3346408 RepID=UPI0036E13814
MLEGLGIEPAEEQVYVALVARPATNAQELADRTGLLEPEVEHVLAELELKGLVTSHPGQRRRLRAAPPDINLSLMALQRMDGVRKAQFAIAQLAQSYRGDDAAAGAAESIEVIEGGAAIAERYAQVQRAACEEIRSLVGAPVVAVPAAANAGQRDALRAGVRYRVVYERSSLDLENPDTPLLLEEWAELGEEMRVSIGIPLKMVVVDDRLALVIPRESPSGDPTALVIRTRTVLDGLAWIFDRVWESALPMPAVLAAGADGPLAADDRHLLSLLLAGYTDQAIAAQQDVSMRTIQRRVRRLLALAGAQSRLQLGWQAARRNWL